MKEKYFQVESVFLLFVKAMIYLLLFLIFFWIMGTQNIALTRPSRTLAITVSTFIVLEFLFTSIYGRYDIGRRKSKPIIYSQVLTILSTDFITYLQMMIMRTNDNNAREFRFINIELLLCSMVIQIAVIIIFTYACNEIFFVIHKPEKCLVITSSQESLDRVAAAIGRFKKQYEITRIIHYHEADIDAALDGIDTVFIYDIPAKYKNRILRQCYRRKVNVYFNPKIEDIMGVSATQYIIEDTYFFNKNVKTLTLGQKITKRLMDIVLSSVFLVISSPFLLAGMIAVKAYDGGPVIYKQERATINGRHFNVYKLRTMRMNSENHSATVHDDRITKPGRILRRTRIDEIPQLVNVIKGDMSLVGPRPEMLKNVQEYENEIPEFHYRLRMKAGLTGYAQINGRYNTLPMDKLSMDLMYIENYSLVRDVQLIFQTLTALLKSDSTAAFEDEEKHSRYVFPKDPGKHREPAQTPREKNNGGK